MRPFRLALPAAALLAALCGQNAAAPPLKADEGVAMRVYRMAVTKNGDDWHEFMDQLEDFQSNLTHARVEPGKRNFADEDCTGDPNCDVVTIERLAANGPNSYRFRIKNGKGSHPPRSSCSLCDNGTPALSCDSTAEGDFVQFLYEHNRCHEDPKDPTKCVNRNSCP